MPEIKENLKPITDLVSKLSKLEKEDTSKDEIVKILQQINYLFLNTELKINGITIIPLETEIYYHNEKQKTIFEDRMIHKDKLQKNHFGKPYFHRYGVDICLSDGDYYLSVLLRTVKINNKIISGASNIRDTILGIPTLISKLQEEQNSAIKQIINKKEENIFRQPRIQDKKYKAGEEDELNNIILGTENNKYEYLDASKLQEGIKEEIKKKFGEKNNGK